MNISEKKIYCFSQAGILLTRCVFKKEARVYGEPLKTSSDGQAFIFKKSKGQMKEQNSKTNDQWIFNIMALSIYGIRFVQKIDILKMYKELKQTKLTWLDDFLITNQDGCPNFEMQINDTFDVMVKITDPRESGYQNPIIYLFIAIESSIRNNIDQMKITIPEEKEFFGRKFGNLLQKKSFFYLHDIDNQEWINNKILNKKYKSGGSINVIKNDKDLSKF